MNWFSMKVLPFIEYLDGIIEEHMEGKTNVWFIIIDQLALLTQDKRLFTYSQKPNLSKTFMTPVIGSLNYVEYNCDSKCKL